MGKIKDALGIPERRVCPKCGGVGKRKNKVEVQIGFGGNRKTKKITCPWVGHA